MNANLFLGEPLYWKEIKIYPPKLKEVLTKPEYNVYLNMLILSQEDIWDNVAEQEGKQIGEKPTQKTYTPLEVIMLNCYQNEDYKKIVADAFYFFTHEVVRIIPESKTILFVSSLEKVKEAKDLTVLNEENFFEFQNKIRIAVGENEIEPPDPNEDPRKARMKAKARLRDRVKKKKGSSDGIDVITMLGAICCMGIGLNPLNIGEIPYPVATYLFEMLQKKEKYETDLKVATAGFGSKKIKPKYWVTNEKNK